MMKKTSGKLISNGLLTLSVGTKRRRQWLLPYDFIVKRGRGGVSVFRIHTAFIGCSSKYDACPHREY